MADLPEAMVALEEVQEDMDLEWAEQMDFILVVNMNLIGEMGEMKLV